MGVRSELPLSLAAHQDLDGLHVELAAWQHVVSERRRVVARNLVLVSGVPLLLVLSWTVAPWVGSMALFASIGAWFALEDPRLENKVVQRLVLTPRALHLSGGNVEEVVPLAEIGRVDALDGEEPVLVIQRREEPALRVPMELEPRAHAVWLARTLQEAARAARERSGSVLEVPAALRAVASREPG